MSEKSPRIPISVEDAKQQASEYFGFTASTYIRVENGKVFEIPNPGLLDDDQQERYEELQFELEQCDREPDIEIPEQKLEDGTVIPARTLPGEVMMPYRRDGKLVKPPYNVQLAIALFGEDGYREYKAGGGIANQIAMEWAAMNKQYAERVERDSKSGRSAPEVANLREGD